MEKLSNKLKRREDLEEINMVFKPRGEEEKRYDFQHKQSNLFGTASMYSNWLEATSKLSEPFV